MEKSKEYYLLESLGKPAADASFLTKTHPDTKLSVVAIGLQREPPRELCFPAMFFTLLLLA